MVDDTQTENELRVARARDLCRRFRVSLLREDAVVEILLYETSENNWFSRMEGLKARYANWFGR